jgi:dTDP-4-dehydrorhamnose 3,5-epimerase
MSKRFNFNPLLIKGLMTIDRSLLEDDRGFLTRFFCAKEFESIGFPASVAQMNYTLTKQSGSIRGMHYQRPPYSEVKVVTCLKGKIFDVAVDIRMNSPTFLHWHGEILSSENKKSLYIPEGFAHGFQTLVDDSELLYLHSEFYKPDYESALNAFDPKLSIDWPLDVMDISKRDRTHDMIDKNFTGIIV